MISRCSSPFRPPSFFQTYDIRFRDVATGKDLDDVIVKTSGDVCWGADATSVFYTTQVTEPPMRERRKCCCLRQSFPRCSFRSPDDLTLMTRRSCLSVHRRC